eukprot:1183396-Prorocentrum_minimum.AAC.2
MSTDRVGLVTYLDHVGLAPACGDVQRAQPGVIPGVHAGARRQQRLRGRQMSARRHVVEGGGAGGVAAVYRRPARQQHLRKEHEGNNSLVEV